MPAVTEAITVANNNVRKCFTAMVASSFKASLIGCDG